ncbi:MAG: SpoIIE family protein phosphatase [Planctomycetes bacterium]|nr:SpoIIE family protein phosphatase [Planctomycetota bacterium]
MALLNFLKGANQGTTMELKGERIVLGRNQDCDVVLNVPAVSREHAVIRRINDKFYIEDMKSRNGTFVNSKEVTTRTLLKDNDRIKICDNQLAFFENAPKAPLPPEMRRGDEAEEEEEQSSTVEATLPGDSKQILEAQPAEKLAMIMEIGAELSQTFNLDELLPKIVDRLFHVFRQADRGFIILQEDDKLIPKVSKTRRSNEDEGTARFSRKIVNRCLEMSQSILSEDASSDKQFDLSQSIADCKIRSVMLAPLIGRSTGKGFGVIQLDTQDRFKKFTQDDLKLLLAVARQAAIALENAAMHERLITRAKLESDLEVARRVQLSFLPKKPPQAPGYEFFAHYEAAEEVGGDYYDFIPLPGGRFAIMVGDVAGKGVPAALLMAKVSSDARFCMLTESDVGQAVSKLNVLMQEAGLLDRFVTLGAGLLDVTNHSVTFAIAGHIPPYVFRKATRRFEEGTTREMSGLPLGADDGTTYDSCTVNLDPGDCVVIFTDGITDAKNKQDKDFHFDGALTALQNGPATPKAMGERLVAAVKEHSVGCKQHDDITVVTFGRV